MDDERDAPPGRRSAARPPRSRPAGRHGSVTLAASTHFASFFLGLEILSVSLYALIVYPLHREKYVEAAVKYLVLAGSTSAFLVFGMALVYAETGTMTAGGLAPLIAAGLGAPFFTTARCCPADTARMPACGGLMMAENEVTPNMPMLEIEKPPPWNSSGFSLPDLARAARSFISLLIAARPF